LVEKLLTEEESMEGKVRQRNFDKDAFTEHVGNAEEENNGYVVFKCKIYGSAVRMTGGGVTPPVPTPFYSRFLNIYLKTT
jgi:hypothetical protein